MTITLNVFNQWFIACLSCNRIETCRNAIVYVPRDGHLCIKPPRCGAGSSRLHWRPGLGQQFHQYLVEKSEAFGRRAPSFLGVVAPVRAPRRAPGRARASLSAGQFGPRTARRRNPPPVENRSSRIRTANPGTAIGFADDASADPRRGNAEVRASAACARSVPRRVTTTCRARPRRCRGSRRTPSS